MTDEASVRAELADLGEAPDARADLAGALNFISGAIRIITASLSGPRKATITRAEIATRQGVTARCIHDQPWRLPDFGRKPLKTNPLTFSYRDYEAWMAVPLEAHRAEWDAIPVRQRGAR